MAERFNLTAQIQLQAPRNTSQIIGDIRKQLSGITANVKIKGDARTLAKISKQMQGVDRAAASSAKSVGRLNRNLSEAARRFSVITVATGTMLALARAIKNAVGEAIAFERELIKISQVTGKTVQNLQGLTKEVTRLSTAWGASSKELLNVSRVLAQAGFSAEKTRQALDILAKTSLGATFNSLTDTTEGAIAVLRQFRNEAKAAGGDIKFLEQTMDAINSVSKKFAVESGDLITVIRRVGGVFEAAGGSVNELIALFTSVRATTRESAETIATGLRTIFTRIQRTDTVDQLAALNIQLRDSQGQFVGAYEAVRRLSQGLSALDPRDFRFSEIVESLGGFRQIGKVIPLIRQFTTAQNALNVAQSSSGSVTRDAVTAQKALAIQARKVREEFTALMRKFADSSTFRSVIKGALEMARAFIRIADALEPLLPLLAGLAFMKIGQALGPGLGALAGMGGKRRGSGGRIHGYASGGFVPGSGNRDTVPAMLQPGEFVIKKSSVKKIGAQRLSQMNGYAAGGTVADNFYSKGLQRRIVRRATDMSGTLADPKIQFNSGDNFTSNVKNKSYSSVIPENFKGAGKRITADQFEKAVAYQNAGISHLAKSNIAALDYVSGKKKIEIKRTLKPVHDDVVRDKTVRALMDGQIGGASRGKLTGKIKPDNVKIPDVELAQDDQSKITNKKMISGLKKAGILQQIKKQKNKHFGGLIQRFAMGGIAKANKIGAAILDEDMGISPKSVHVGVNDVKPHITGSGFNKDIAQKGIGRVFKGKQYNILRQGLNKKTSEGFRKAILEGAVSGVDKATSGLSSDLGLGKASLTSDGKSQLTNYLGKRGALVGDLYESALHSLNNRGAFKESQVSAPFDFPGGLSGKIRDNFDKLPSSWIDAKSSYAAAGTANMKGKIANEIADEYKRSGEYAKSINKRKKKSSGGKIDSVPALLTPGEYVINKSSAQSIGYSNLNKMNQTGAQRFATGGAVGWKRFAGGGPTGAGMGLSGTAGSDFGGFVGDLVAVEKALQKIGVSGDKLKVAMTGVKSSLDAGIAPAQAFDTAFGEMKNGIEATKKAVTEAADVAQTASKKGGPGDIAVDDAAKFGTSTATGGLVAGAATGDKGMQTALADAQAQEIAAIQKKIRQTETGVSASNAYTRAQNAVAQKYGVLAKEAGYSTTEAKKLNTVRKRLSKRLSSGWQGTKKIGAKVSSFSRDAAGSAGKVGAGAQQAAFFTAALATTAIQMSGLSDATKKAATEAIGFGASIVGIGGTVAQMFSGLASATAMNTMTEGQESTGNILAKTTEDAESTANMKSASAGTTFGGFLAVAAIAVTVAISALKYFSARSRATAEEAGKSWNKSLKTIQEGGLANNEEIKKNVALEVTARARGAQQFSKSSIAIAGGYALAGAALGQMLIPIPFVGAAIGGLIGAIAGVGLALWGSEKMMSAEQAVRQAEISAIMQTIDTIIDLNRASAELTSTLATIGSTKGLTEERQIELRLDATSATLSKGADTKNREGEAKLVTLAKKLGVERSELRGKSKEQIATMASKKGSFFGGGRLSKSEQSTAVTEFETATLQVSSSLDLIDKALKSTSETINIASNRLSSASDFDELQKALPQFNAAIAERRKALKQEQVTKVGAATDAVTQAGVKLTKAQGTENIAIAQKGLATAKLAEAAVTTETANALKLLKEGADEITQVNFDRIRSEQLAIASSEALRKELNAMNSAMKGLRAIQADQEKRGRDITARKAISENEDLDFSSVKIQGLGDISLIDDVKKFENEVGGMINELPPAMQGQFKKMLSAVSQTSEVLTAGKDRVLKQFSSGKLTSKVNVDKIASVAGVDLAKIPDAMAARIREKLQKAVQTGGVSSSEFDDAFADIKELGTGVAGNLKKLNDTYADEIKLHKNYLDALESERDKELKGLKDVHEVSQKGVRLRTEARGGKLTLGQREEQRTSAAQLALRGTRVRAGDARGAARTLALAKQQRILNKIAYDNSKKGLKITKEFMTADKKLIDIIKKTGNELERLGDQSEKAADIMDEIKSEKAKRETIINILTDFVKGGASERRDMINAMKGVRLAVTTGTIQNQTPAQRSATIGLLDKLENIVISGTGGMTGKDVKQEIVFRDAIRMGLDPKIALMLATATSKEQQLINALDNLTRQMVSDAAVRAALPPLGLGAQGGLFPAQGGLIYRAGGGNIFQPKGTDTVPAMLTPGEFVVKKSAVNQVGTGTLKAINSGRYARGGLVQYHRMGGMAMARERMQTVQGNLGSQGNIKIPTGDQVKRTFQEGVRRIGPVGFLRIIKQVYGGNVKHADIAGDLEGRSSGRRRRSLRVNWSDNKRRRLKNKGDDIAQSLSRLMRSNSLNLSRLTFPDRMAGRVDNILAHSDILESVSSSGIVFKSDPKITTYKKNDPPAKKKVAIDRAKAYAARLKAMKMTKKDIGNIPLGSYVTDEVFKKTQGFSPLTNLVTFGREVNRRYKSLKKFYERLERGEGVKFEDEEESEKMGRGFWGVGGAMEARGGKLNNRPRLGKLFAKVQDEEKKLIEGGILRATGGGVPGTDTVPAMLTPGEFVMSKGAVQQHGVGYMKNLNRGRISGFNRGGVVGGVQYKADGGVSTGVHVSTGTKQGDRAAFEMRKLTKELGKLREQWMLTNKWGNDRAAEGQTREGNSAYFNELKELELMKIIGEISKKEHKVDSLRRIIDKWAGVIERAQADARQWSPPEEEAKAKTSPIEVEKSARQTIPEPARQWSPPKEEAKAKTSLNEFIQSFGAQKEAGAEQEGLFPLRPRTVGDWSSAFAEEMKMTASSWGDAASRWGDAIERRNVESPYGRDAVKAVIAPIRRAGLATKQGFTRPGRKKMEEKWKSERIAVERAKATKRSEEEAEKPFRDRWLGKVEEGRREARRKDKGLDPWVPPSTPPTPPAGTKMFSEAGATERLAAFSRQAAESRKGSNRYRSPNEQITEAEQIRRGSALNRQQHLMTNPATTYYTPDLKTRRGVDQSQFSVEDKISYRRKNQGGSRRNGMTSSDPYKTVANGGVSIDPTLLGGVLDTFNTTFSATIDRIVAPFTSVSESLGKVAEAFGSMTMTHTFSGNIAMSINIANKDAIIAAVSEGIKPKISELITNHLNKSIDELKNTSTG